jgi:hypothetical protein
MLEFEQQSRYIAWHTDTAAADSAVPFNVHASNFITSHVVLHAMEFFEDTEEVVEVFQAHVFYAEVIYDEAELDGSSCVAPETRC